MDRGHASLGYPNLANGGTISGNLIITGNLTVQGTTTSVVNQTTSGTVTITVDNTAALTVEKADGTNVLVVDTTNSQVLVANGSATNPTYGFANNTDLGLYRFGANGMAYTSAGVGRLLFASTIVQFKSDYTLGWSSGVLNSTTDLILARDGAGILAQRNTTNAQMYRIYNTFTDASNYERFSLDWQTTANTIRLSSGAAGTGTVRPILITAVAQVPTNTAGAAISITTGAGNGTGNGGALALTGGASGSGATGNGGDLTLTGGGAASTNGNGGNISFVPGAATGSGTIARVIVNGAAGGALVLKNTIGSLATSADEVQLGAYDLSAGNATLALSTETAVAIDVIAASTHTLSVRVNGTTYKILLST